MEHPDVQPRGPTGELLLKEEDVLSPLVLAQRKSQRDGDVNVCPFGCQKDNLDEHGYCRHLIGFTNDTRHYEPVIMVRGKRKIFIPREKIGEAGFNEYGEAVEEQWGPPQLPKVQKDDVIVQITTSWRVYREKPEVLRDKKSETTVSKASAKAG